LPEKDNIIILMKLKIFQPYIPAWFFLCLMLGTTTVFIKADNEVLEVPHDDPFVSVFKDMPDDVKSFLLTEYEEGVFKKIELGGTYGEPKHSLQSKLIIYAFSFLSLTAIVIVAAIKVSNGAIPVATIYPIFLLYAWTSLIFIYGFKKNYNMYYLPGYLFLTDVGLLLIEQGSMDQFSWLYYKDIECVNDTFVLVGLEPKRVLRIIDKVGQIQDYDSELIDPIMVHRIFPLMESKVSR
jgi:hypothetical protein